METSLKQLVMAVLLAGSVALGAQRITLDTMVVDAQGNKSSLFEEHSKAPRGGVTVPPNEGNSITFYVEVAELSGARRMKADKTYRLDSFSLIGHPAGWWSGRGRELIIANGNREVVGEIEGIKNELVSINFRGDRHPLTFRKNDLLEVTITSPANVDTHVEYFDAPPAPAKLKGTALNLLPDGSLAGGNRKDNIYNTYWRYTCPAVRLRATELEDAYNWRRIGMIGGGALIVIFLLKPLFGAKRRKNS